MDYEDRDMFTSYLHNDPFGHFQWHAHIPMAPFTHPITPDSEDGTQQLAAIISQPRVFQTKEGDPLDFTIISEDAVSFTLQRQKLLERSTNLFGGLLGPDDLNSLRVSESSEVINTVLLIFYNMNPTSDNPSLDRISSTLSALSKYGLPLEIAVKAGTPLYQVITVLASGAPLDAFALVCHHNLEDLATEVSSLLLSVPLRDLTEEQSIAMGPFYLRRLISLHMGRREKLKTLLQPFPVHHQPGPLCNTEDQRQNMDTVWREVTSDLLWESDANTPPSLLDAGLSSVVGRLTCDQCKAATKERTQRVVDEWTSTKRTI